MKKWIPFVFLVALISSPAAVASTSNSWHNGYPNHDSHLGFDIYWKWGPNNDVKRGRIEIRLKASIGISELCGGSTTYFKPTPPLPVSLDFTMRDFNPLPPHQDSGVIEMVGSSSTDITGWLDQGGVKISKTTMTFLPCQDAYPSFNFKERFPYFNGFGIVKK